MSACFCPFDLSGLTLTSHNDRVSGLPIDSFPGFTGYRILRHIIPVHLGPTSPIDSNMSSIGTLEVPISSCLSPPDSLHTFLPVRLTLEEELFDLMAMMAPYDGWNTHARQAFHGRVCNLRGVKVR